MARWTQWAAVAIVATAFGCSHNDKPHDYGKQRPPVDSLDKRDAGLQSRDLLEATDLMAASLLSLPELNASDRQWTIVASNVENQTTSTSQRSYDIFVDSLRTSLAKEGKGRITLIENRERYRELQSKELEPGAADTLSGPTEAPLGGAGIQPDFILYAKAQDMPNKGTNTFRFDFNLTSLRNRTIVWTDEYLVKVAR